MWGGDRVRGSRVDAEGVDGCVNEGRRTPRVNGPREGGGSV